MSSQEVNLDDFATMKWATSALTSSSSWWISERHRNADPADGTDRFCGETITNSDGIKKWVEAYQKPEPGSKDVKKSMTLCKLGPGLSGFVGITHGGVNMTIMDEALGFMMISNEQERLGDWENVGVDWRKKLKEGRPLSEVLEGFMVTAKFDLTFLRPVMCPGVIGVDVELIEKKGHKMRLRGFMKDADGNVLVKAEGLWVRIGGVAKI